MIERLEGRRVVVYADGGLAEVERYIGATPKRWSSSFSQTQAERSWDLGVGWEGALKLAKDGWTEGAKDLSNRLSAIPPPTNKHAEKRWSVAGDSPSVPRYLTGNPAHMMHKGRRNAAKPVISLVVNIAASGGITANEFVNYGTAVAAMADLLEAGGRRVEIDVLDIARMTGARAITGWKVKRAEEHMDLSAVAFSIAHPASLRRLIFALMERTPRHVQCSGYGGPQSISDEDAKDIGAEGAFILDGCGRQYGVCKTQAGALTLAARQINKAAGEELVTLEN